MNNPSGPEWQGLDWPRTGIIAVGIGVTLGIAMMGLVVLIGVGLLQPTLPDERELGNALVNLRDIVTGLGLSFGFALSLFQMRRWRKQEGHWLRVLWSMGLISFGYLVTVPIALPFMVVGFQLA